MNGITRIEIHSNWNDRRVKQSREMAPSSNELLREIFSKLNMELMDGDTITRCSKEEAAARYDWKEGIDVILRYASGSKLTLQEKGLTYKYSTATFEIEKNSGKPGAWYTCTAQYYLVYYARKYPESLDIQDWVLIDFPRLKRMDEQIKLNWYSNDNHSLESVRLNRRAKFKYLYFDDIPDDCIVERKSTFNNNQLALF